MIQNSLLSCVLTYPTHGRWDSNGKFAVTRISSGAAKVPTLNLIAVTTMR